MEEQQWRSESVALDAPPTVQTTTVPAPKMPVGKQIPWKWVFGAGILVVALVAGLLFLKGNLAKNQKPANNGQVKTQDVDLGKLAKNTTPLTLDKTDRVVINGQLQTTQGLVINPTAEPTTSVLGQVYLDSTTGDLRYYNGTTYLTIANSGAVGLTQAEVLALLTAFGTKLPQDLATTASPLFGGLKLNGTNGNAVLLQAAAGTANMTLTLPANDGAITQCLTTDGAGTLSFSACASGSGNAFLQGGNSLGAAGDLGTNDINGLNLRTNSTTRLAISSTGDVAILGAGAFSTGTGAVSLNGATTIAGIANITGAGTALNVTNNASVGGNVGIGNATPGNRLSINSPTSVDGLAQALIATGAVANKGLVVQGVIFQTGSLLELQEHTGSSVFSVGATGNTSIRTATNSVTAFQVQNSAGSGVLNVDTNTSTGLVGIGIAPAYKLDVNGDINIVGTSALRIGGTIICTASGCDATSGSGSYIQNGNGIQSNANFGIQSANATYIGAKVRGAAGQSASLLELQISNATPVFSVGSTGNVVARPSADSATAFQIQNAAGSSNLLIADTNLNYVGIGIAPAYKLDVNGDINIVGTSALRIGGTIICTASGCDATSGSGSYIQNGNGIQPGANFGIQSANATYVGGVIKGAVSQIADLFQLQNSAGTNLFNVTATGAATFQNTSDTTGAFRVLDAAGTSNVLVVDTLNKRVGINTYPSGYALDVNGDVNLTSAVASLRITGTVVCNLSGCAASSGSGNYIQNGNGVQTNGNFAIQSANIGYVGGLIRGAAGQTADMLQIQNSGAANLFKVDATGNATFQNSADNSAAFNIKQSGGTTIFWADTLQGTINATNTAGNAFIGTTNNNLSYGVVGTQSFGVGGGVKGVGGGGYGVLGQSETNASGLFQTTNTAGTNTAATLVARANTNQSTSVFEVQNTAGTSTFSAGATGSVLAKNSTNSTTAFQVQNAAGNNYLLVNTSGASISVGDVGIASTIQIGNTTGAVAQTVNIGNNTTASSTTTTTVGSKIGTSPTKIQAGTTGVVVQAADSVNAFSVQNAAGTATLFNIDTTNSVIKINGNNSGTLQAWANTTPVGSNFIQHATVSNGSYLYRVAGLVGLSLQSSVNYAPINPDGTVGAWANTTALAASGAERQYPGAVIANGYMYVIGGADSGYTQTNSIYYGAINSDGTISSWQLADNKMATAVGGAGVVAHNGYLYVIGGGTTADYFGSITPTNSVQYAKLNADGSVGSFCVSGSTCTSPLTAPPALTDARMVGQAIVSNGYLYYVGGRDGASIYGVNQKDIYRTLINSDGSLGAWTKLTGVLNTARGYLGVGVLNGYLYAAGGGVSSYEYAKIGASGALGAFTQPSNPLTVTSGSLGMATANGYFYIVSGSNLGEVQYASGPRTYVGGSLDLVGLGGNGLQSSSGGGTLTAGNTLIAGRFRVTDAATFMQGVSINGDISGSGQAVFRNTTNSSTAFQIQNSSGESVLIADTVNNIILPGLVASSTATLQKYSTLAVGSMYRTGLNAFLSYTGYPTLSFGDTLYNRIGVIQCVSYDCANPTVPSPVYIGKPNGAAISIVDTASYDGVKLSNNNPLYVWRTGSASTQGIWYQRCGTYDCSSGNSDTKYVTAGAANTSCYGLQVTTTLLSNNFPMFLSHGSGVSTCGTKVWAMVCGDVKCDTSPTSKTQIGTQSGSDGLAVGMTYCSDALRLQTSGANMCPLVVHNTTSPSSGLEISLCNTTCSSSTSANFTVSPTVAVQNGSSARPIQVVILGNGLPVIARQNISNNIEIIHCKSLLCTTYDYNIVGTTSTSKGFSLILGSYNGQSLPQIVFNDQSTASMKFIQCKTDTCDPASNIVTVLNGAGGLVSVPTPEPVASMIGNDGLPLIFSQGSATLLQVTHCVDLYCAALSGTQSSGGVLLGSKPNAFQGLYVSSINDGSQSSGFQYTNNGLVVANYLTSDKIGNVLISSATSTALQVTSLSSGAIALSVDAASSSVNIGTATTVAGYGFNSAVNSLFKSSTNSTTAFNIQNASGASLFSADTSGGNVNVTQGNFVINNFTTPSTPTTGTISNSSGTLSGAASTYYYKVTSVGVGGESAPSAELSVPLTPLTAPTALTAAASVSAGNVTCNATGCNYKVTFVTANGETDGGTTSNTLVNVTSKQITLTAIPLGGSGTTSRRIYRSTNGGAFLLDQTIANNTSTTATDNITTPSGAIPASNTAYTNLNSLSINFTAVTGAGSYNFYRSTSSGAELKCTITAPTTITSSPAIDNGTWTCGGTAASSVTGFGSKVGIGINAPTTSLDVRGNALFKNQTDTATAFQIQNAAGNTILGADTTNGLVMVGNETNAFYATLDSSGLSANRAITFPDSDGAICLTSGNCLGSGGGGGVSSSGGTANYLPKFTLPYNLANSILQETGGITILNEAGGFASGKASTTTGSLLFYNSTNANTITLQSGATAANLVLTLPTTAGINGDCLQSNGSGVLSFGGCTGGAGGGVTSIDGQTGVVTVNNATGSGGVLTIDDASTSAKGIASFNSTNFSVSSGAVNTIQNINTGATPQFAGVLANSLDTAAAGTLTIGGSTQTAISLGRTGITTTNAGSLTVSQLLTAGLANNATLGITGLTVNANADINGIVAIGSGATPNAFYALGIGHDFTAATNASGCPHVFFFGNVCSGIYATANSNGLTGLTDVVAGGSFGVNNTGSTVLETAYGLIVRSATNSGGSSIVSAIGLSVATQTVGTSLNYGVSISTSSTSALQLGADLATPTAYNSGVSFGYDNDTVLFRTALGQLAVGTGGGATTLKLSPTAITSTAALTISSAGNNTITVGSTSGASALTLQAGSGVASLQSNSGGINIGTTGAGSINIGTNAVARTVNIATGAAAQSVTLGSSTGASSLLLASGTGGITFAGHIISGNSAGSTATAFAVGAAACTSGVATSSAGNDTAGKIIVTTGASGCAAGTIVTVTFGTTYTTAPMVVLTPGDSVTAGENLNYFATPTATTFVLGTQTTTTISKTLTFYYFVIR